MLKDLGKLPVLVFAEKCCDDRRMIQDILDEHSRINPLFEVKLLVNQDDGTSEPAVPLFDLPTTHVLETVVVSDTAQVVLKCDTLIQEARKSNFTLGLDIEWNPKFIVGTTSSDLATIQILSITGISYIFKLFNIKKEKLKRECTALKTLLESSDLTFVGAYIKV